MHAAGGGQRLQINYVVAVVIVLMNVTAVSCHVIIIHTDMLVHRSRYESDTRT
jgi:hypothetical protein